MRIPFFTVLHVHQLIRFVANESPSLPLHISAQSNGFCHCALYIIPTKVSHRAAHNRNSIEIMLLFCRMCTKCNSEDGPQEGIEDYWITTPPSTSTDINMEMIRQRPSMYSHLLTESAYEELEENCTTELFNASMINLADDTPALTRVIYAIDLHDTFSLAMAYLQSWGLPCLATYRHSKATVTGIELLAIGTSTVVNWIGHMLQNGDIMRVFFRFNGLHFMADAHSAVATQKTPSILVTPHTTPQPKRTPKTQLWVPATLCALHCIRWPSPNSTMDSDESSLV